MPLPSQIAVAVNGYCKALRLLGREDTSIGQIAGALCLTPEQVSSAFENWKIAGTEVSETITRSHQTITGQFYPVVSFKRRGK